MSEVHNYLLNNKWVEIENMFDGKSRVYKTNWNLSANRSQVVWAQLNDTFFQIVSPFAKEGDLSAERALNMNMTLLGVSVMLGHYCLVSIGTVANFSATEFETLEQLTARFADDMEMNSGGGDVL
jgi:hypothetical protein